ncbi:MAG: bifunctional diaminohydroxyphosphoribosylaminopyrimidine deaminase/5-amino-6-(5-phosphoribosylamino)uracil reductase RibD [Bacteroidales bacterium]|nr:bifunctional diaminohydroxyphosphoribosylaminopyrimidine deaminase/5-amino-6-(5-phosphoribosylamino)uracil reductase RibD [Bacteroidales bacterium]
MTQEEIDIMYMRRCLQLAANGMGFVRPNPMVGCVVVKEGRIISEGYHQEYGHNHAERNALLYYESRLLNNEGADAKLSKICFQNSTLYVNLEPCSHYGKTPPCADLIIEKGIKRVVCCNDDPNPLVAGKGFRKLEEAGVEVVRHVLEEEGRELNRRFFTFMERKRPYVILKWAESADGFMAPSQKGPYWISNDMQTIMSHKMRTEEAAILVGSQTYIDDKPQLTARLYGGNQPQPVVLDRRGRLKDVPAHWMHLRCQSIAEVLHELFERKMQSLIVEGGRKVLDAFIEEKIYDEIVVFRGATLLGEGIKAPTIPDIESKRLHII